MFGRKVCYLASGWFNETQVSELDRLERVLDDRSAWIELRSPRRIFVCPPNAARETQESTYSGNLRHIRESDMLVVNTRDKDIGTLVEAGYAIALGKRIVYFCAGLPERAKFNLMLACSGIKVCTSFEQFEDYLDRSIESGDLLVEPYAREIE